MTRTRRAWPWFAGALLLALALGAGLSWSRRAPLTEALVLRILAARGVPASLHVERLDLGGLELTDLALGTSDEPELRVARTALVWSWRGLRERRLDHVELSGVRLRARLGEAGLELGALDALRGGDGERAAPPAVPFAELQLRDAEAAIDSARGPLVLRAEGGATSSGSQLSGSAELSGSTPWGSAAARLRLGGGLDAPRADVSAQLTPDAAVLAPLSLEARLAGTLERLAVQGEARTGSDGFRFSFDGTLEPLAPRVALAIRLPDTDLAPAARQPARLFPWLGGLVQRAKGRVAARADATYAEGTLSARAEIAFADVDLRTEYATLRRLNGVVTLSGPEPLVTPPGQTVSVARIEGALPLSDGVLRFALLRDATLQIEEASFGLAGGTLSFAGSLPLEAEERTLVLTAKQLSVQQILAALDFEGLSGSGFLDGRLPLEQRGRQVRVVAGELHATEPGVIRYAAGAGSAAVAAEQPQLAPALGALADLRYEALTLEVSGDVSGQLDVKVHARGRNPNFQQGRPVVLNVNVEAPVQSLLQSGLAAYRVPEEIEAQVKRFFDRGKP
jgi:hypothetical protein